MGKAKKEFSNNFTPISKKAKKDPLDNIYDPSVKLYIPEQYKAEVFSKEYEDRIRPYANYTIERNNKNIVTFTNPSGKLDKLRSVVNIYEQIYRMLADGIDITENEFDKLIKEYFRDSNDEQYKWNPNAIYEDYRGRFFTPRTENQIDIVESIRKNIITIVEGAAGTGKSRIALIMALNALSDNRIDRIIIVRPLVTVGEDVGFLPGDLSMKVSPYNSPISESLIELLGKDKFNNYVEEERIQFFPVSFARGCNIANSYVIIDEAQNMDKVSILTMLTRICGNTKMIITGDESQDDRKNKNRVDSALTIIKDKLRGLDNVGVIEMSIGDVQRSGIVKDVLSAFEL